MTLHVLPSRRRFLGLTGAGVGVAVAGCAGLSGDTNPRSVDDESTNENAESGDGDVGVRQVTLVVEPDQEALQEAQMEIQERVENEEIDPGQAQEEFLAVQQELVADAVTEAETAIEDVGATTNDAIEEQGALLIEGPADGLIDLLEEESVAGLVAAEMFIQAREQQG